MASCWHSFLISLSNASTISLEAIASFAAWIWSAWISPTMSIYFLEPGFFASSAARRSLKLDVRNKKRSPEESAHAPIRGPLLLGITTPSRTHDSDATLLQGRSERVISTPFLAPSVSAAPHCSHANSLHDIRNVARELPHASAAKLLHDPVGATGEILLLL